MKKLYRSRTDYKLFGLCGGLADYLNVDSTLLRVVLVVTAFFSGGTVIPIYFIACLVIPKEPAFHPFYDPVQGYSNYSGYTPNMTPPHAANPGPRGGHAAYGQRRDPYRSSSGTPGYDPLASTYPPPTPPRAEEAAHAGGQSLDELMRDVEKKALRKEIEELRAKLAKYEKSESKE